MALIEKLLTGVAVDPASVGAGAALNVDVTIAAGQVRAGDFIIADPPDALEAGLVVQGVSAPADNTIRIRLYNPTAAPVDGVSRNWNFAVVRGTASGVSWAG